MVIKWNCAPFTKTTITTCPCGASERTPTPDQGKGCNSTIHTQHSYTISLSLVTTFNNASSRDMHTYVCTYVHEVVSHSVTHACMDIHTHAHGDGWATDPLAKRLPE
mmetsp:Transcript_1687/g.2608  ORF Transcript_1687/g.2608 Transcript_1687/m.2608 type:complete len:107 (-) Transcript_1687:2529-2849(-)